MQELIWSGLDSEDRGRLRETCCGLRDEVERSCTTLKVKEKYLYSEGQAESLVKLSGRLPRVRTLQLTQAEAVQALSLDPPPAGEQHAWMHRAAIPLILPASLTMRLPPLPLCLQLMRPVSRGPQRLHPGPVLPTSRSWQT